MAGFDPYTPIKDEELEFQQHSQRFHDDGRIELIISDECPEAPPFGKQKSEKNCLFHRDSNKRILTICSAIAGIFALANFIVLCYLIPHFHIKPSTSEIGEKQPITSGQIFVTNKAIENVTLSNDVGEKQETGKQEIISEPKLVTNDANENFIANPNDYSGLEGRFCRLVNVEDPNLVVNVHGGNMHDGSLAITWDKSEVSWNSHWRVMSARDGGGVRFEVISAEDMKVLEENVDTNMVIVSTIHTDQNMTADAANATAQLPSNQVWILMDHPSGNLKIKNQRTGRYLKSNGKPNQLSTIESTDLEDKSHQWNISIEVIWNKEKHSFGVHSCSNS